MSAGVRIIMFGRQGAGKGTQSARLAKYFAVPHISTGEMLRNAVKQDSVVGRAAKTVLDRGELVDDGLMVSLVQGRIGQEDARTAGFVLDGFPRTIGQATAFDELTQARPVGFVIDLDVKREVVVGRLSSRRHAVHGNQRRTHVPLHRSGVAPHRLRRPGRGRLLLGSPHRWR